MLERLNARQHARRRVGLRHLRLVLHARLMDDVKLASARRQIPIQHHERLRGQLVHAVRPLAAARHEHAKRTGGRILERRLPDDVRPHRETRQHSLLPREMFRRPLKADGHGTREMGEEVDRTARHGVRLVEHNRHLAARRRDHGRQAGVGPHRQKRIRLQAAYLTAAAPERAQVGEEVLHGQRTRPGGEHRSRPALEHARLDITSAHPDRHVVPARRQFRRNRESREGMAPRSTARDDQLEPHVDFPREEPTRQRPRAAP